RTRETNRLEHRQLAASQPARSQSAAAYLPGNAGGRPEEGSFSPTAHAALIREHARQCSQSDAGEPGQAYGGSGQGGGENPCRPKRIGRPSDDRPTVEG